MCVCVCERERERERGDEASEGMSPSLSCKSVTHRYDTGHFTFEQNSLKNEVE